MDDIKMACETLRPVYFILGIILTALSLFVTVIMKQHEKKDEEKNKEIYGFIKRKNKEDDDKEKRISDLESSLYRTFADVRVLQEKHMAHKELCEERHKDR